MSLNFTDILYCNLEIHNKFVNPLWAVFEFKQQVTLKLHKNAHGGVYAKGGV